MEKNDIKKNNIRILIIEDNPGDSRLFKEYLKEDKDKNYDIFIAETLAEGMKILGRETIDIVLTDLGLPDSKGLDTSNEILKAYPSLPIIITTGLDDEKTGIDSIKVGVQNYLVKNNITPSLLIHSIKFSIEQKKIVEELKKSKEELWQQRELIKNYYKTAPIGLAVVDKDLKYLYINTRLAEMNGFPIEAHIGHNVSEMIPQFAETFKTFSQKIFSTGEPVKNVELQNPDPLSHGSSSTYIVNFYPLRNLSGEIIGINISLEDVTERKQYEMALKKSQEENLAIVNALPDLLFGLTNEGVFVKLFSPRVAQLFQSPEDYFGQKITEFLPLHLATRIMLALNQATKINELVTFEDDISINGENRYFEFRIQPLANQEVLIVVRDISKRKKAEEGLVQSEAMFRKLLSTSPEAIIRMDIKSRITAYSDVTPGILGFKKTYDIMNLGFIQFIANEGKQKMRDVLKNLQTKGLIQNIEVLLVKNDKSTFLGEISLAMIEESDGKPNGYIAIIRDITSRRIMEMQMIHNARMLSLGEMAAGIAHEINQPLNIISITLENLMLEVLDHDATDKTYIKTKSEKIFDNITRMRNIIDHIRSFSRDHDDLIHGMFEIHDSITNAISMISEQFRYNGIEIELDFDKNINPVPGDIYKFEQVILNLLTNAKDAIEEKYKGNKNPGKKYVKIRTYQDLKSIYVEVADDGIGIKSGEIEKVLIPFFTTKETGKGTGLGLSISYGIIKEMQGVIGISSKRNVGTTVQIKLPVNPEKNIRQN
jgi:PAS domain S-box-containing protein